MPAANCCDLLPFSIMHHPASPQWSQFGHSLGTSALRDHWIRGRREDAADLMSAEYDGGLRCRRNRIGTVGFGKANYGGTQLRTRAHLGNGNHQERTPQSFYDLPTNACYYVGQGTPASGIRSAARTLFSSIRTGCTIYLVTYLDAAQPLSASRYGHKTLILSPTSQ
jgi:hypothetical protein